MQVGQVVIDPLFVCSYNTDMTCKFAGFFRPDHDPPLTAESVRTLMF
jgi:hypothetical protein